VFVKTKSSLEYFFRIVTVNTDLTPQQALGETNGTHHVDSSVLTTAPMGESGEVKVEFIKIGRSVTDDEIELELVGTRPATFAEIAKANEDDPALFDTIFNCTHWKGEEGEWCYATFHNFFGERLVYVSRYGAVWDDRWFFARVRNK